ncbi:hypothetical protein [Mariniradius sediminis]|uniref:DUF2975 domain-containing protein n=1 Tax=Mariniradius sediminis TaxID=2909237 RepID=A0ABS9BTE7_9BACT|nr:hypothetical protein [Mariniradius sediminis]MCF1750634.1 hypothetical protein [Mariniradius sediminis]
MQKNLSKGIQTKIKGLAYYQIMGGIFGIGMTIWLLAKTVTITGPVILIFLLAGCLYSFSVYCGQQLLKGNLNAGFRLSTINQVLQSISFAFMGYAFKLVSGILLGISIDLTGDSEISFALSLSTFKFNINHDQDLLFVGVNFLSIYLIYFIGKLKDELEEIEG